MKPTDIRKLGDKELMVTWEDGHRSLYPYKFLRFQCACAGCIDELSGKRTITMDRIDDAVYPREIETVGHYALRFMWSDGHATGIYSFELLRQICQCPVCQKGKS